MGEGWRRVAFMRALSRVSGGNLWAVSVRLLFSALAALALQAQDAGLNQLHGISVESIGESPRITLTLDRNTRFKIGQLTSPHRLYIDLSKTRPAQSLSVPEPRGSVLRAIRVAERAQKVTRVALELQGPVLHFVTKLKSPPRLVIDMVQSFDEKARGDQARPVAAAPAVLDAEGIPASAMDTALRVRPPVLAPPPPDRTGTVSPPAATPAPAVPAPEREPGAAVTVPSQFTLTPMAPVAEGYPWRLTVPKVARVPKITDFLRNTPREAEVRIQDFRQREPGDGIAPSQKTTAYVSYDRRNLYVVFVCQDDPALVRAHMAKREDIGDDDKVHVYLDTYRDRQRAYVFSVNAYGIQRDAILTEGRGSDGKYDTLWYSEARMTPQGWVAWIAIPFKSVRFSGEPVQTWGLALSRSLVRNNETDTWPHISRRKEGFVKHMAMMEGLESISTGRNVQLIPYASGVRSRVLTGRGYQRDSDYRAGMDAKIVMRNALTLDLTANPDFSQVESDDPQVTVNQRYEVYFPEKRPFFLENAGFFETPINLFFSRRIVDPQYGARLTGKLGNMALGALLMDDRAPGRQVASSDPNFGKRAYAGVFSARQEFKNQSYFGVLLTDREFGNSADRVFSVDGRINLGQNWYVQGQAVRSMERDLKGREVSGPAYKAQVTHAGRHFNYTGDYTDFSPDFRAPLGFVRRVDVRQTSHYAGYYWIPEGGKLLSFGPGFSILGNWDRTGRLQDRQAYGDFSMDFAGPLGYRLYHYDGYEFYDGKGFNTRNTGASFYVSKLRWLSIYGSFDKGMGINYAPVWGIPPHSAGTMNGSLGFTVKPTPRAVLTQYYYYSRLTALPGSLPLDGPQPGTIFNNHLLRSKVNYQFTKALSLRAIVDYYGLLPNTFIVYDEKYKQVTGDLLLTYMINPGTALHVGYNNQLENLALDPTIPFSLKRTLNPDKLTGQTFYVKLSYLLRL